MACAGDLAGMRLAADRILPALKRLNYAGPPVWEAVRERLAPALAVAAQAAAVPLEAEGLPYVEPKLRVSAGSEIGSCSDLGVQGVARLGQGL